MVEGDRQWKIGVLQFFSWPGRQGRWKTFMPARSSASRSWTGRLRRGVAGRASLHTFSVCPSVHMMGMLAAARTKRLRIGTAVSLAALYHPLRLAEEVALLDMLSGGRVNWGAGRGFAPSSSTPSACRRRKAPSAFARPSNRPKAWTRGALQFTRPHFAFDDVEVLPKPLQQPHPPVWMAATSEQAIDWAAGRGFSILMDPHASTRELGDKRRRYAREARRSGLLDAGRDIPMARLIALAPTQGEAETVARRGAQWLVDAYAGPQHAHRKSMQRTYDGKDPAQHYVDSVILHGTPNRLSNRSAG